MTSLRRALIGLGVIGFIAGLVPLILSLNNGRSDGEIIPAFGPVVGWSFIATGLYAWYRRPDNRFGALMAAVGFSWCISGLIASDDPVVFGIGGTVGSLPYAFLIHMLLAYPSGQLETRLDKALAGLAYFVTVPMQIAWALFVDPRVECASCPENGLRVWNGQGVADAIAVAQSLIGMVGILGLIFVLVRRWRGATPMRRQALSPIVFTGIALSSSLVLTLFADLADINNAVENVVDIFGLVVLASIPFGFLAGLLRGSMSRAGAVRDLVERLGSRGDSVRDALADALGDPDLSLAFWLPERSEFVNAAGRRVELPPPGGPRVATTVDSPSGEPVGAIVHAAELSEEMDLVCGASAAATLALENERLEAELRYRVEELRSSRARIVEAGLAERRRLERNLHDGAQQRLVSLALSLRLARGKLRDAPEQAEATLDGAAKELELALDELRELARGLHPAVLSDRGLEPALESLARRAPLPVEVSATHDQLPDHVELAAYFVVAEALTNVAKYAQATKAKVAVSRVNGSVTVEVSDDGVGGVDPSAGTGLRGLADRVGALEGRLEVVSGPYGGTTVVARIPCG